MSKQLLAGAAVAAVGVLGGVGGYAALESLNDEPVGEIPRVQLELYFQGMGHLALAPEGSCEDDVLTALYVTNAADTLESAELTKNSLDKSCGEVIVKNHFDLSEQSSQLFAQIQTSRAKLDDLSDTTVFDWQEKLTGVGVGVAAAAVGSLAVVWVVSVASDHRKKQTQAS